MNRRFFIFLGIFCVSLLSACHKVEYDGQTGRIYHKEYNPALNINYILDTEVQTWDTIRIDLDKDNETDMKICFQYDTPYIIALKDWELSVTTDGNISSLNWWSKDYHVFMGHITAICLRNNTAEGPCYGWIDCYTNRGSEGQIDAIRFYLREIAYCTCPNYPLKWGEK